jgi:anti-anti-sigma factor
MQTIQVSVDRSIFQKNQGDTAVVTLKGELGLTAMVGEKGEHTGVDGDTLLDAELRKIAPTLPKLVIIDLNNVSFLASMGIGALLRFQNTIKEQGGELRLSFTNPMIETLLKRIRVDIAFKHFPDVASALKG